MVAYLLTHLWPWAAGFMLLLGTVDWLTTTTFGGSSAKGKSKVETYTYKSERCGG